MASFVVFSFFIMTCAFHIAHFQVTDDCVPRHFNYNSFVCVCNSTYCDFVDRPPEPIKLDEYYVYTTSKDKFRLRLSKDKLKDQRQTVSYGKEYCHNWFSGSAICVDTSKTRQTIIGFGGSFTDAVGINMENLTPNTRKHLMESYFGQKGIGYNMGRVPIGGCDFSERPYSLDESIGDFKLINFTLAKEDFKYKIPIIKEAQRISSNAIKLVASSWSSPSWMKINQKINGFGSLLKGVTGGKYYQTYADYHVRFLKEYIKNGIDFWAITSQNEPIDGFIPFFPFNCMGFLPNMQRIFVNENLRPALDRAGLKNIKLFVLDDNRPLIIPYLSVIMQDVRSNRTIHGVALHWYFDKIAPPLVLDWAHEKYPDKPLLMTEASFLHFPWSGEPVQLGNWDRASDYAFGIIENLNHWVTGWIDWNLALDPDGGPNWGNFNLEGTIIINKTSDEFYKQPIFYIIGHFAKFVTPGSKVIEIGISPMAERKDISAIAFVTPESTLVLVVLNKNSYDVSVNLFIDDVGCIRVSVSKTSIQTYLLHS